KQCHLPQLHLMRTRKYATAKFFGALAFLLQIAGAEVGYPRIWHGGISWLRDKTTDGKTLHAADTVFISFRGDFPAQNLAVEFCGLFWVRGGEINPVGHAYF